MAALTTDRNTPAYSGGFHSMERNLAASTTVFAGSMVAQNAAGDAVPAAATNTLTVLGRAANRASTVAGSTQMGSVVRIERGVFRFANSASSDAITIADYGKPCYAVDDQTVAKTNGSGARPQAGIIRDVDAQGVWVEF
jgi:hypothetical protein